MNDRFIYIREKLGLSQSQIAEYLDVEHSYVAKIENGELGVTMDLAEKMCNLIGCNLSFFADGNMRDSLNINLPAYLLTSDELKAIARINAIVLKLKEMREILQ